MQAIYIELLLIMRPLHYIAAAITCTFVKYISHSTVVLCI